MSACSCTDHVLNQILPLPMLLVLGGSKLIFPRIRGSEEKKGTLHRELVKKPRPTTALVVHVYLREKRLHRRKTTPQYC